MTQKDVASAAGVDRSWLARLEAGSENPTLTNLLSVITALGLEVSFRDMELDVPVTNETTERSGVSGRGKPTLDEVLARLQQKPTSKEHP